jgi:CRISPR system Cascade subunit CasE
MTPDMAGLMRWAGQQGVLPDDDEESGYMLHAALAAGFGDCLPKPFAMLRESGRPTALLAYSDRPAPDLIQAAALKSEMDAVRVLGVNGLASKPMPDRFASGRVLGFSVRVRPTVRVDREGDRNKVRELDAFLATVERSGGSERNGGQPVLGRSDVYAEWLRMRLSAGGADLRHLSMNQFRLVGVHRRNSGRHLQRVRGPIANFTGQLTVRDPEAFAELLRRGVGRHRAFGFGMLLLRPA